MTSLLLLPVLLSPTASPIAAAPEIRGQYIEARTCDVYAGSCFANADTGITGKNAVLVWKVNSGTHAGTKLDGLGVIAIVSARETLGLKQTASGKAIVLVDEKATPEQREALVSFVKAQAGDLAKDVIAVRSSPVDLTICNCDGESCATLKSGEVQITTRCINAEHDKACGNESTMYPPLARGISAKAAMTTEHRFNGQGLNETWSDPGRRGAFVGSFATR